MESWVGLAIGITCAPTHPVVCVTRWLAAAVEEIFTLVTTVELIPITFWQRLGGKIQGGNSSPVHLSLLLIATKNNSTNHWDTREGVIMAVMKERDLGAGRTLSKHWSRRGDTPPQMHLPWNWVMVVGILGSTGGNLRHHHHHTGTIKIYSLKAGQKRMRPEIVLMRGAGHQWVLNTVY